MSEAAVGMGQKTCARCKTPKFTSEFYKDKRKKDGLNSSCKACCAGDTQHRVTTKMKRKIEKELAEVPFRVIVQMLKQDHVLLSKVVKALNPGRFQQLVQLERAKIFAQHEKHIRTWSRIEQAKNVEDKDQMIERRIAALRAWQESLK